MSRLLRLTVVWRTQIVVELQQLGRNLPTIAQDGLNIACTFLVTADFCFIELLQQFSNGEIGI